MDPSPATPVVLVLLVALAVAASITVWMWVIRCRLAGQPVVPYQPRRPVPWRGVDVALILLVYLLAPAVFLHFGRAWFLDTNNTAVKAEAAVGAVDVPIATLAKSSPKGNLDHPIVQVLTSTHSVLAVLICVFTGAIAAPITEELLFRMLLQGWLESIEHRLRRTYWILRRFTGVAPVLLVATIFALMHCRKPEPVQDPWLTVLLFAAASLGSILTLAVLFSWLRWVVGATMADLGFVPDKFREDVKLGLLSCAGCILPVYVIMAIAKTALPPNVVADPIPLFVLAVVLGGLYFRTHRIVPSMILHFGLNATSLFVTLAFK